MGSALDARGIKSSPDNLVAHVEGIIENVDGVPLIITIRVRYTCKIPKGKRAEAERALGVHEKGCPATRSARGGATAEATTAPEARRGTMNVRTLPFIVPRSVRSDVYQSATRRSSVARRSARRQRRLTPRSGSAIEPTCVDGGQR